MPREYPRFLFSYPKDTKSKGPFLVHTLYPKVLFKIGYFEGSYLPEILEVWESFNTAEESQSAMIPLMIEVQAWAQANNIKRFIKDSDSSPDVVTKMTKQDFLNYIPDIIEHPAHGYGELEIISDDDTKGACYRHKNNLASGGNYGKNWGEVFTKMYSYLKKGGHIK